MNEWKRLGIILLSISILFFLVVDLLMYQSITDKNIKLRTLENNIETLFTIREYNKTSQKEVQVVTDEVEKMQKEIDELTQKEEQLKQQEAALKEEKAKKETPPQPPVVTGNRVVYLTFDDGPSPRTSEILDILKKYNVKATFFVTNQNSQYDYLIKRAYDEGHTIGLHTSSHNYHEIYASEDAYFADLQAIQDKVYNITGYRSTIIRFPGGSSNTVSRFNPGIMTRLTQLVEERGFYYHDWNVDSEDAAGANEERQMNNVMTYSPKHEVVNLLMHDSGNKYATVNSLEAKIKYYLDNGYSIEPITPSSPCVHHGVNN